MKYTPGPWEIKYEFNVMDCKGRNIAACGGFMTNVNSEDVHAEKIANTLLIAAAPDMYEALDNVCSLVCRPGIDCSDCKLSFIEKLLQKARGE